LAFPLENGFCDVVRAKYKIKGASIHIAQSRYLFSVVVEGFDFEDRINPLDRVQFLAAIVLNSKIPIELVQVGSFGKGIYGIRKMPPSGPIDVESPHWLDELRWWYENGRSGFITLKATGGPTREVISPERNEFHLKWFGKINNP
jgi:hypothetical protein